MEHNLDKTVSSERYETTQDAIIDYYLAAPEHRPDVIVVNTGLHPMSMCSFGRFTEFFPGQRKSCWRRRKAIFAEQAQQLLRRLRGLASTVIWVTISAVNDALQATERLSFSSNQNSIDFNGAMQAVLEEERVIVLDTFRMSSDEYAMHELHSDPVHLRNHGDLYYKELAAMLAHAVLQSLEKLERTERAEGRKAAALRKLLPREVLHLGDVLRRNESTTVWGKVTW
jgi:hypothetical protein